jgi:uncharacterized protein
MRLVTAAIAALVLSACASTTTHPAAPGSSSGPPAGTTAPALDCTKPSGVQQLVCGDAQLTDLDRRLQTAYQQALARPGADSTGLTTAQNDWVALLAGCAQNADARTCVLEAYQTRLVQLAIADPATVAPPVVTYNCPAGSGPLTAQFYNQFDPQTAVLNWKGTQMILFIQPAASGARYGRRGSEYWEHQGEVKLDLGGTTFVCGTP